MLEYSTEMIEYSKAESILIEYYGYSYILNDEVNKIDIFSLYNMLIEKAFVDNDTSVYSSALRKAWLHLKQGGYRGNIEFDNIIIHELRREKIKKLNL